MSRRAALSLWMLAALLVVMTLTASGIGALRLPVSLLWNGTDEALRQIWLTIRLPRVLLALAIGGSLACCHGSAMMPSFASFHSGEWAALARRSGRRCWPSRR